VGQVEFVVQQYRTRYWDFTVKHFHEALHAEHGFRLGSTWTRAVLKSRGLVRVAPQRSVHRKEAAPTVAEDDAVPEPAPANAGAGSQHDWLAGQPELDLIVTLDDATSEFYPAFLLEEDGTASSFMGLSDVIAAKGSFASLYTDRGSHCFLTPTAAERNRFPLSRE
jgi:hypothetical protein